MTCPSCGAEVLDLEAAFCPRCAAPLGAAEAEATEKLETLEPTLTGEPALELPPEARSEWLDAAAAGGLSFLFLLCVGAVLLLAAKLQYPSFGSGADPVETFSAIAILSLGILRVPIHIGDLSVAALPLGALAAVAWGVVWSVRGVSRRRSPVTLRARLLAALRLGAIFGALCLVAALVFRFRGSDPVHAGAVAALLLGTIWGTLFGALAGVLELSSFRERSARAAVRLKRRSDVVFAGAGAALVIAVVAAALASGAALVWIIVRLAASGTPANFDAGDAVAAVVYLLAFAPNVVVTVIALSLGAPVDVGAQVTLGGRAIGELNSYSLLSWGDGGTPGGALLLLLIPIVACVVGGTWARRHAPADDKVVETVGSAAIAFGVTMFVATILADARLGAGLVRSRGFGLIAPDPWIAMSLGVVWVAVLGAVAWLVISPRLSKAAPRDG